MKSYILLVTLLIIIFCHWSSASSTGVGERKASLMVRLIGRRVRDLWAWVWKKGNTEQSFVARCFGVARQLKFVMPILLFKLGVIVTILVFLTIFSLKGLALLLFLVIFNTGGLAAKLAKHGHNKYWEKPQDVHFHVHSKDFVKGGHNGGHSDYEHDWYDKNDVEETEYESLSDRLKKLNIYDKYRLSY